MASIKPTRKVLSKYLLQHNLANGRQTSIVPSMTLLAMTLGIISMPITTTSKRLFSNDTSTTTA